MYWSSTGCHIHQLSSVKSGLRTIFSDEMRYFRPSYHIACFCNQGFIGIQPCPFVCYLWPLSGSNGRVEQLSQRWCSLQGLKYLLLGSLQKRLPIQVMNDTVPTFVYFDVVLVTKVNMSIKFVWFIYAWLYKDIREKNSIIRSVVGQVLISTVLPANFLTLGILSLSSASQFSHT